jgi:protein-L-isoaspartate(D-aspartate) O-methyltransferase
MNLTERRRFYAEEIQAIANIRNPSVVEALAAVPRERFLGPGPWTIRGEGDVMQASRQTADGDPRHVYHNLAVAIDPDRQLFNGAPTVVAMAIDVLALKPGDRVLHVGCGTGYYTALMASCVGPGGRVVAIEVDERLAARARSNLSSTPWVDVRDGDGSEALAATFDAVLVNAGVTHPLKNWIAALHDHGRMVLPLTVAMAPTIGKGLLLLLSRKVADTFDAKCIGFVAIYSAIGVRDAVLNDHIGRALKVNPFPALKSFRRDPHDPLPSCWLHTQYGCLST